MYLNRRVFKMELECLDQEVSLSMFITTYMANDESDGSYE